MFSSRTQWDFRPTRLFSLLREKRERHEEIIDLTESNPTRCGFSCDGPSLLRAISDERSLRYEPHPRGLLSARLAIAEVYRNHGVAVEPEQIVLTASTSEAYLHLFRLLCNERDAVLIPKPSYPLLEDICQLSDIDSRPYRLAYDGEWHIDLPALRNSASPGVRALVLVHPNNPTGSFVKAQERDALCSLAREWRIAMIVDEVFGSFAFGDDPLRSPSFAEEHSVLTFTLNGLSKLCGLPQMKLAWIVVSGPEAERDEALNRLEMIGDLFLSVGTPIQHAVTSLLRDFQPMTDQILDRVRTNYRMLREKIPADSQMNLLHWEGGWNSIVRLPGTQSDEEWSLELLRSHNVLTHPGYLFGCDIRSCLVVSLLPESQILLEGLTRILGATEYLRARESHP